MNIVYAFCAAILGYFLAAMTSANVSLTLAATLWTSWWTYAVLGFWWVVSMFIVWAVIAILFFVLAFAAMAVVALFSAVFDWLLGSKNRRSASRNLRELQRRTGYRR